MAGSVRERRLAETLARRQTQDFQAGGDALLARRQAEDDTRRARDAAAKRARFLASLETETLKVSALVLERHDAGFQRMLREAADDSGYEEDVIASDILDSYIGVHVKTYTRRGAATALELYRIELGLTIAEALTRLERTQVIR